MKYQLSIHSLTTQFLHLWVKSQYQAPAMATPGGDDQHRSHRNEAERPQPKWGAGLSKNNDMIYEQWKRHNQKKSVKVVQPSPNIHKEELDAARHQLGRNTACIAHLKARLRRQNFELEKIYEAKKYAERNRDTMWDILVHLESACSSSAITSADFHRMIDQLASDAAQSLVLRHEVKLLQNQLLTNVERWRL